jgi:hypothetical protein
MDLPLVLQADATRRPTRPPNETRKVPQGFFDSTQGVRHHLNLRATFPNVYILSPLQLDPLHALSHINRVHARFLIAFPRSFVVLVQLYARM